MKRFCWSMVVKCLKWTEFFYLFFRYLAENVSGSIERPGSRMENLPEGRKAVRYIEEE